MDTSFKAGDKITVVKCSSHSHLEGLSTILFMDSDGELAIEVPKGLKGWKDKNSSTGYGWYILHCPFTIIMPTDIYNSKLRQLL